MAWIGGPSSNPTLAYVLTSATYGRIHVWPPVRFRATADSGHPWNRAWLCHFAWEYPRVGYCRGNFGSSTGAAAGIVQPDGIWYWRSRLVYPHDQETGLAYMKSLCETGLPPP